jgi:hypothetical protein
MRAFKNDASQAEKRDVLRNERALRPGDYAPTTMHDRAKAGLELDTPGGRYRAEQTISGAAPTVDYPKASPPWSADGVGVEPPLGYSVNDLPPTGTAAEVERSLGGPSAPVGMVPGSETIVATSPTVKTGPPIPSAPKRRRILCATRSLLRVRIVTRRKRPQPL